MDNDKTTTDEEMGLRDQQLGEDTPLLRKENAPVVSSESKCWRAKIGHVKHRTVQGVTVPSMALGKKKPRALCFEIERADGSLDYSGSKNTALFSGELISLLILHHRDDGYESSNEEPVHFGGDSKGDWVEEYSIPLPDVKIVNQKEEKVNLSIVRKGSQYQQSATFLSIEEASSFVQAMSGLQNASLERARNVFTGFEEKIDGVKYLVEIGTARNLREHSSIIHDTNPYCVVRLGRKEIHRTKVISTSLDPIWTISSNALFLLETSAHDLIQNGVVDITFEIMDKDTLHKDSSLGYANLPLLDLFNSSGETMRLGLKNVKSAYNEQGFLTVKCRKASKMDLIFFVEGKDKYLQELGEKHDLKPPAHFTSPARDFDDSFAIRRTFNQESKKYLVTPPDPLSKQAVTWMTHEEIEKSVVEPSRHWTQAGTGNLGYLFLEILGCDDLPLGHDAVLNSFVTAIFEDVMLSTSVVDDTIAPRYMPWTQRAFMFNIDRLSSTLFLAVHSYGSGSSWHDFIGKVSINLANIRPNMVHVLNYNLYSSSRVTPRSPSTKPSYGTIKIRLSVEWIKNVRHSLTSVFSPRKNYHVNTEKKRDFYLAQHAMMGTPDFMSFSVAQIKQYGSELSGILGALLDIKDAAVSVFLWRNTFEVPGSWRIKIPLHSMFVFACALLIKCSIHFIPFVFFISLWWIMLALLGHRNKHSATWERPRTFNELLQLLIFGKSLSSKPVEPSDEDIAIHYAYKKKRKERIENIMTTTVHFVKTTEELLALYYESWIMEEVKKESTLNPMKQLLFPVQKILGIVCDIHRRFVHILTWQRSDLSFWISLFFLVGALLSLIMPWLPIFFILGTITEWSLIIISGPWWKLLDVYCARRNTVLKHEEDVMQRIRDQVFNHRETFMKNMDMMKHLFGKHIMSLPSTAPTERFYDYPLSSSHSEPIPKGNKRSKDVVVKDRVMGIEIELDMIPTLPEAKWREDKHTIRSG